MYAGKIFKSEEYQHKARLRETERTLYTYGYRMGGVSSSERYIKHPRPAMHRNQPLPSLNKNPS